MLGHPYPGGGRRGKFEVASRNLYICHTVYQVLIALLKMNIATDTLLLLDDIIQDTDSKRILYQNVKVHEDREAEYGLRSLLFAKERAERIAYLKSFDNIYISLDHRFVGIFLNKHKIPYYLMEDAYNFFSDRVEYRLSSLYTSWWRRGLYRILFAPRTFIGSSPYCISIEVNDISVVREDKRYRPFVEYPRKQLFARHWDAKKDLIYSVFRMDKYHFLEQSDKKQVLILTQPLYWIYVITEEALLAMYLDLIQKYREEYHIVLKPHPRDVTDYSFLAKDVTILDAAIPFEILELSGRFRFDIGISYDSKALEYMECVREKIFLKEQLPLPSKLIIS